MPEPCRLLKVPPTASMSARLKSVLASDKVKVTVIGPVTVPEP